MEFSVTEKAKLAIWYDVCGSVIEVQRKFRQEFDPGRNRHRIPSITRNTCPSQASAKGRPDDNMVYSPLSIATALSLMWMASAETTEEQLRTALRYPLVSSDNTTFHAMFRELLDAVLKEGRGVVVDTATAIIGNRGVQVQSKFYERAETYYDTQLRSVPFEENPELTRRYINDFVKKATRGKIPELFQQTLDPKIVIMLINVVYFEGMWESQFAEGDTRNKPFFVSENEVVETPTLHGQLEVKFFQDQENGFTLVGLPYKEREFYFYIIMPHDNFVSGLKEVEAKLTPQMLKDAFGKAATLRLRLELPKIDLNMRMDLQPVLETLGVCDLFGPEASLTKMSPDPDLHFTRGLHQAKLIVNERGTEAEASTILGHTFRNLLTFKINLPFLFVIMDDRNSVPIFMGRIVQVHVVAVCCAVVCPGMMASVVGLGPFLLASVALSQFPPPPPSDSLVNRLRDRVRGTFDSLPSPDGIFQSPAAEPEFVLHRAMLDFGLAFHRTLTQGISSGPCALPPHLYPPVDNAVYSPLSIAAALSMLWRGAANTTEQELRSALRYPQDTPEMKIHELFGSKLSTLTDKSRGAEVHFSSTLFGNLGLRLVLFFYQDLQTYYNSTVRGVDFNNPAQAMADINRWVRTQTQNRIKDIISTPPAPSTKLVLANAVYFKGNWEFPFNKRNSKEREFVVSPTESVQVPMMQETMELPYVANEELGIEMVGVPYLGTEFGFFIVLPTGTQGSGREELEKVERGLTQGNFNDMIAKMEAKTVLLTMPILESEYNLDLRPILAGMGVCSLFIPDQAELTRIAVNESSLYVSDMIHQANIIVNEEGSEASAATVTSTSRFKAKDFRVNRPFLYMIRDNESGIPLFIGRVVNPRLR
ncbi:unnamed protein product [Cyprideis torosa]|uniref:Uncharacterized protein n=1 Tax=Cyprideis torosa TaxID=163714 RepID=A0A7R8W8D2_9CRUS|nr:unnamed protein product [Cyprideis torosa]CAG0883366.1 unnamed protein product [Cyprideis torosa]